MYSKYNLEEDHRFKQCNLEMWVTIAYYFINVLILWGVPMIMGYKKPANEIYLTLGFPDWFFYGGLVGTVIICILPFIMIRYFFKEMSLEPYDSKDKEGEEE